ncbi:hypothetical protein [Caedibacter taeniospiralis]|jgi:hypothetical protein|uniref:hypothetical protein n=1 Tax=Caedibacter taeniospiralis TaxID=28907 RepID=UPI0037C042D6
MAIKISKKGQLDVNFTIEDSSRFFNTNSKGINPNAVAGLGDSARNHIKGFTEKHVQAALENIAQQDDSKVSGNQQDGFTLDETVYKKLQEFYKLEDRDDNFAESMEALDKLNDVITAAKEHSENSSKALDTFKASVIQTLLTSENVEGVKTGLDAAAEKLKQDLEYNNPKWYIQFKGWIGETLENIGKGFVNGMKWLFNKLGLFTTTDLEKRQAALEIDYRASLGKQTSDSLDLAQQASLNLFKGIMAEFDGQRPNKDTLVSQNEVTTYLETLKENDTELSKAINAQANLADLIVDAYKARDLNQENARNALARANHKPEYLQYATYVKDRHEKHKNEFKGVYDEGFVKEKEADVTISSEEEVIRSPRLTSLLKSYQEAVFGGSNINNLKAHFDLPKTDTKVKKTKSLFNFSINDHEFEQLNPKNQRSRSVGDIDDLKKDLMGPLITHNIENLSQLHISTGSDLEFKAQPLSADEKLINLLDFITRNTNKLPSQMYTYYQSGSVKVGSEDVQVTLPRYVLDAYDPTSAKNYKGAYNLTTVVSNLKKDIENGDSAATTITNKITDSRNYQKNGYDTALTVDGKNGLTNANQLEKVLQYRAIEKPQEYENIFEGNESVKLELDVK